MYRNEKELQTLIRSIGPGEERVRQEAHAHWDSLAKPLGSLGVLEEDLEQIAALQGNTEFGFFHRRAVVYCADNGVTLEGVTQTDMSVTAAVLDQLAAGRSSVCQMARVAKCKVIPVDVGVRAYPGHPRVRSHRIGNGTGDIRTGPAMSREQCLEAIWVGIDQMREFHEKDVGLVATGEMGIGNTTTSSAVASVLLDRPVHEMTGRGAGLSTLMLEHKIDVICEAVERNGPDPEDPVDVLAKVGGFDLAALCGTFLGGAHYRIPVLMDGFISSVAALCAVRLCPNARKAVLASHLSTEPAAKAVLEALDAKPLIRAEFHLGEGTGAVAAIPLLEMAAAVYRNAYTFEEGGIPPYRPL